MVNLEEFLREGGKVNLNSRQQAELRVIHSTEIASYSRNLCYIAQVVEEGIEKVVFIKVQENPEKEYYVNQFALSLALFPINPLTHFGDDFCIYPLIENYQMCKDRLRLARYLATIHNRYDERVHPGVKARFEAHPGYRNKYRTLAIYDFKKSEHYLAQSVGDVNKLLDLLDYWLHQEHKKVICHSDYKPHNTFLIENSEEIGILDLEDLCADTQTFDLARLLACSGRKEWDAILVEYSRDRNQDLSVVKTEAFFDYALYVANVLIYFAKNPGTKYAQQIPVFVEAINYVVRELPESRIKA